MVWKPRVDIPTGSVFGDTSAIATRPPHSLWITPSSEATSVWAFFLSFQDILRVSLSRPTGPHRAAHQRKTLGEKEQKPQTEVADRNRREESAPRGIAGTYERPRTGGVRGPTNVRGLGECGGPRTSADRGRPGGHERPA